MNLEIEYKYLVDPFFFKTIPLSYEPVVINQAYLMDEKDFNMRVRIEHPIKDPTDKKASLTTKTGKKPAREEYEITIPLDYAEVLFANSFSSLQKLRYKVPFGGLTWEIDHYPEHDLVIAEVEVPSLDYKVLLPPWAIKEVTHDGKYSNTNLARKHKNK
jgi:CYTH domain-containing protein